MASVILIKCTMTQDPGDKMLSRVDVCIVLIVNIAGDARAAASLQHCVHDKPRPPFFDGDNCWSTHLFLGRPGEHNRAGWRG